MPAVKITQKPIGIPGDDTHFLVTQPELPEGYTPTGQETEEELAELKVESLREIEMEDMVELIQDKLDMDVTPTTGSSKPVTSGGIKAALDLMDDDISSLNEEITNLEANKQDALTFDSAPTAESTNPVTSAGIKTALDSVDSEIGELKENLTDFETDVSGIITTEERYTVVASDEYETYEKYILSSGVPSATDNSNQRIMLVPVTAGEKIRFLGAGRVGAETIYAFHSVSSFSDCTTETCIETARYTDITYKDLIVPEHASCILIEARFLKLFLRITEDQTTSCLKVGKRLYTIDSVITLEVNSGWQSVTVRTIIPPNKKVSVSMDTVAAYNRCEIKIGKSGNGTAFKIDDLVGCGTQLDYFTPEFITGFGFNVYNVTTAGEATISITVEDDGCAEECNNILYHGVGENLFNPDEVFEKAFFYPTLSYSSGNCISGYIPIANGESLSCNYVSGDERVSRYSAVLVKEKYSAEVLKYSYTNSITNDLGYDAYALFVFGTERDKDAMQVNRGENVAAFKKYNPAGRYVETEYVNTHGKMGALYPEEMEVIDKFVDRVANTKKLHFVHISDNHGSMFGYADDFTDHSNASFLVNTGDMVHDAFSDPFDMTSNSINAMVKPGYITLGNHDVYGSSSLQSRFEKFFTPIAAHNGMAQNTKTYYAVDFPTQGVKCLFLDNYDGLENYSTSPIDTGGVMSDEQIRWFISQLDDAITKNYHVCVFQHYAVKIVNQSDSVPNWYDQRGSGAYTAQWMPQVIDAFQTKGSVSLTYNGVEYNHTFAGYGIFVAYFGGHEHCDICGTIDGYPHQFNVGIARPVGGSAWEGVSRNGYAPYAFNYVTIHPESHHLSIYRVGEQFTPWGTKRDAMTWRYWTYR